MEHYKSGSAISGRLRKSQTVKYISVLSNANRVTLMLFLLLITSTSVSLLWFILSSLALTAFSFILLLAGSLVVLIELIRFMQSATLLTFAWFAKDPQPMAVPYGLRIAILTTIVPGKEPFAMVEKTLRAMKAVESGPGNIADVWLLDEGNDFEIKAKCRELGVKHFSRKGIAEWNTESGAYRARTKHGNHNAWRSANETKYDIVAVFDPDHIPRNNLLIRTLGYFTDPQVGFVVSPQKYGNLKSSWVTAGAASQSFIFHGIIQRGGNGMGMPLLEGTNHLYRVEAFRQIGGYQDSIIEDHLTALVLSGSKNSQGQSWKGVYTPDILAIGEGPSSFTDYFSQQKRWSYGVCDVLRRHMPSAMGKMSKLQATFFLMLQFFYPSLAITWAVSSLTAILFSSLILVGEGLQTIFVLFLIYSIVSNLGMFFWLRRFNLVESEQKNSCLKGMALTVMCIPIYANAAWQALIRKPLTFAVTGKANLASPDSFRTFSDHFKWLTVFCYALTLSIILSAFKITASTYWLMLHIFICSTPIMLHAINKIRAFSPYDYLVTLKNSLASALPNLFMPSQRNQAKSEE